MSDKVFILGERSLFPWTGGAGCFPEKTGDDDHAGISVSVSLCVYFADDTGY